MGDHIVSDRAERPTDGRIRLAVLAAHPVVRVGLRHLLESQPKLVLIGEASRTAEGAALVASEQPNVVLLDPDSEDFTLEVIANLAALGHGRILIFTAATEPKLHSRAVALGAMGVVQKHHSGDTLGRAVEKVHAGEVWLERGATASMLQGILRGGHDPEALKIHSLTKRELEVIGLVGSGLKSAAIAGRLFISQATVRNHLTSILGKLDLSDRFELAFYASKHGLVQGRSGGIATLQSRQPGHGRPPVGEPWPNGADRRRQERRAALEPYA
jgi:two-component system nitrate/nitrite response regulator NarL